MKQIRWSVTFHHHHKHPSFSPSSLLQLLQPPNTMKFEPNIKRSLYHYCPELSKLMVRAIHQFTRYASKQSCQSSHTTLSPIFLPSQQNYPAIKFHQLCVYKHSSSLSISYSPSRVYYLANTFSPTLVE